MRLTIGDIGIVVENITVVELAAGDIGPEEVRIGFTDNSTETLTGEYAAAFQRWWAHHSVDLMLWHDRVTHSPPREVQTANGVRLYVFEPNPGTPPSAATPSAPRLEVTECKRCGDITYRKDGICNRCRKGESRPDVQH